MLKKVYQDRPLTSSVIRSNSNCKRKSSAALLKETANKKLKANPPTTKKTTANTPTTKEAKGNTLTVN